MKTKHISLLIALLLLLTVFSACDVSDTSKDTNASESTNAPTIDNEEPDEFNPQFPLPDEHVPDATEPKDPSYEWDPDVEVDVYPDVEELETDLAEVDYSKFVFMPEPVYIDSDKELSIHNYDEARQMLKAAEAHNGEKLSASSYEEAVALLSRVVEGSGDNKYVVMVSVSYKGQFGAYYVGMGYIEMYNMYPNSGENQDLLFYTAKKLERSPTEALIRSWEFFAKYSHINSITFYTVPVVNVTE